MGRQFGRESHIQHRDEERRAGHLTRTQQNENASLTVGDGLTRAQRSMLAAQQTIGNQAVLRRMAVQRDEDTDGGGGGAPAGDSQSMSAGGSTVTVDGSGVNITDGIVNLNAALVKAPGIIQTDTIIANTVVGSSYTPGAGNIM